MKHPRAWKNTFTLLIITIIVFIITILLLTINPPKQITTPKSPIVTLQPSHFFYGVNVEMSQILPGSIHYIINSHGEDLIDIASHLGINLFRITNTTRISNNDQDAIYTQDQWNKVLGKMQEKGIRAIIQTETASNNPALYNKTIQEDAYLPFIQKYLLDSHVLSHPDVFAVDIQNEPILTQDNIAILEKASRMIKNSYPDLPITVGWWGIDTQTQDENGREIYAWDNYGAGVGLDSFIDFYSLHLYGFDQKKFGIYPPAYFQTMKFITSVGLALHTDKPMMIEEFGSANGDALSDQETLGSPQQQANSYLGVYQAVKDLHNPQLIGTIAYQFYPKDQNPDAWAIAKDNGNYLFPASYVLQKFATGKSDVEIPVPFPKIPDDHILKNADNNTIINVSVGDIIGISLDLPTDNAYLLENSNNAAMTISEHITYYEPLKKYVAVLHAKKSGTAAISIKKSCKTILCSQPTVYQTTINIQ